MGSCWAAGCRVVWIQLAHNDGTRVKRHQETVLKNVKLRILKSAIMCCLLLQVARTSFHNLSDGSNTHQ
eukprot:84842-Amphidinium_carterae.1